MRGRVQQRTKGRTNRGKDPGKRRSTLDLGAIEGYANRLANRPGAASGLAGAASGLAGGSLASRFMGGTEGPEEDFKKEVAEQLALIEERLQRLEEQMLGEQGSAEVPTDPLMEPEGGTEPGAAR